MGHFAKVVDSKVVQVIVAEPDFFTTFVDSSPGQWIQTSYRTHGNQHPEGLLLCLLTVNRTSGKKPRLRGKNWLLLNVKATATA